MDREKRSRRYFLRRFCRTRIILFIPEKLTHSNAVSFSHLRMCKKQRSPSRRPCCPHAQIDESTLHPAEHFYHQGHRNGSSQGTYPRPVSAKEGSLHKSMCGRPYCKEAPARTKIHPLFMLPVFNPHPGGSGSSWPTASDPYAEV